MGTDKPQQGDNALIIYLRRTFSPCWMSSGWRTRQCWKVTKMAAISIPCIKTVEVEKKATSIRLSSSLGSFAFQFRYEIFFESLTALGQYNMYYFWSNYDDDFNITLVGIKAAGKGVLEVSTNGTIQVNRPITHNPADHSLRTYNVCL